MASPATASLCTLGGTLPASVLVLPVMEPTMMQRGPAGLLAGACTGGAE